jgi:pSer/pThr/pTyr-binding forkhead associated (FHA) protein
MPEVTLELLGKGTSEKFTKPEIRLGRDPACDLVFRSEEFPMVGRQHAILRSNGTGWDIEDLQSTNGTFVNQVRVQRQQLEPGDTLRLGSDGPEVRVHFVDASFATTARMSSPTATTVSPSNAPVVTPPSSLPPTRPATPAAPSIAATRPSPTPPSAPMRTINVSESERPEPDVISPVAAPDKQEEISEEEDPMNDQKLSLLRNLVILMVGLVLVLGGIVISQMQQLSDIRQNVMDMRAEAKTAVGRFQPELDQRLNKMQANMDAMDGKMQAAQDKFMKQIDAELPKVLDKYIDKKMKEINAQVPAGISVPR